MYWRCLEERDQQLPSEAVLTIVRVTFLGPEVRQKYGCFTCGDFLVSGSMGASLAIFSRAEGYKIKADRNVKRRFVRVSWMVSHNPGYEDERGE
ncbi:unnamed protein product [Calypogeia fissa]